VIACALVSGLLIWSATAILLWRDHDAAIQSTHAELGRVSLAAAEHARRLLSLSDLFLDSLEQFIELGDHQPGIIASQTVSLWVDRITHQMDGIMDVGVVDRAGFRHILPIKPDTPVVSVADRDYVRESRPDAITVSIPVIGRTSGEWMIPVARRTRNPKSPLAVLYTTIHLPGLERIYDGIRNTSGGAVTLFRRDGVLLARAPRREELIGKSIGNSPLFRDILPRGASGTFRATSAIDGVERLSVYNTIEPYGLVVVVSQTYDEALAPWRRQVAIASSVGVGVSIVVAMGTLVLLRLLNSLAETAGDLDRRVAQRTADLNRMMEVRTNFLTSLSHELRTPLNAVIGFSDALLAQVRGPVPERQAEYVRDILRSGQHLLALVNDLLDGAAIDAGSLHLDESEFALDEVMEEALSMVTPRAAAANTEITLRTTAPGLILFADRRRILQAVLNLFTNAVKYNRPGGGVRILVERTVHGACRIVVDDDGIGMTQDDLKTAMTPFGRASDPSIRAVEGTGLGLPLTSSIIEFHGGSLTLDSQPGRGTTVTILLPAGRLRHPVAARVEEAMV
jgi:signal transduction histidine kinase